MKKFFLIFFAVLFIVCIINNNGYAQSTMGYTTTIYNEYSIDPNNGNITFLAYTKVPPNCYSCPPYPTHTYNTYYKLTLPDGTIVQPPYTGAWGSNESAAITWTNPMEFTSGRYLFESTHKAVCSVIGQAFLTWLLTIDKTMGTSIVFYKNESYVAGSTAKCLFERTCSAGIGCPGPVDYNESCGIRTLKRTQKWTVNNSTNTKDCAPAPIVWESWGSSPQGVCTDF